jgi:transcriptional regulator with XRE-family HTH domain
MITATDHRSRSAEARAVRPGVVATARSTEPDELDALTLGRRIRERRQQLGMTLDDLAAAIGRAPSQVSMIENGKREPRLSMLRGIADALSTSVDELVRAEAPNERAALEIAVERAVRGPVFASLGLPGIRAAKSMSDDVLKALLGLHGEIERLHRERASTPEEARRANAQLRAEMRARDNYYPALERQASDLLEAAGHTGGPVSQQTVSDIAARLGYSLHYVNDLPYATRSVTDRRHHRVYLPVQQQPSRDSRSPVLQALASQVLGHDEPRSYADFLRQRVETNYLTAAVLLPEKDAVRQLTEAKNLHRISMEDLRDAFAVSYETAAHRFTNLATMRLGIPVHFMKVHESGTIVKAYENDSVRFPSDATGAIEGTTVCRNWTARTVFDASDRFSPWYQYTDTPAGTFWCTSRIEKAKEGEYSVSVGVPFAHVKWFRGRDTANRAESRCPDESCCHKAPAELADAWAAYAWPAARTPTSLLAALPTGSFPGVDETEVYEFLQAHAPAVAN